MSDSPGKLSQFWQELKRRNVVRVITVYAATAFVILELVDIVAPSLRLPEWTMGFVIVLLCVGFVLAIVLSWIYDITPKGVVKTDSIEVHKEREPVQTPPRKLFNTSNMLIVVLFVVVAILLYPKIFKPDRLSKLRNEEGSITVAVLPFDNLTGDSSLYFWQNGISEYLINGLGNSDELLVSSSQVVSDILTGTRQVNAASLTPDIARQTAEKIKSSTYVTGNFIGRGEDMSIMVNLMDTENGEILWSTRVDGDLANHYRMVLDRLSDTIRNYLELKSLEEKAEADVLQAYPNSAEAYRHYIEGLNAIMDDNYEMAIESLTEAYEIDTTFTFAAFYLAFSYSFSNQFNDELIRWTSRAHQLRNNLPQAYRPWIDMWYSCYISADINDIRKYCDMMYEAALNSRFLLFDLGVTYTAFMDDYQKSISAYKKLEELNRLWEDDWRYDGYYTEYTYTLLMADRPEDVDRIADIGHRVNPDNTYMVRAKGAKSIMMNDSAAIQRYQDELSSAAMEYDASGALSQHAVGLMYCWGKDSVTAADYFRRAYELDPERMSSLLMLLSCQLRSNLNIEECLKLAENGLEKNPESQGFLWAKGVALHKLGQHEEALSILREAEKNTLGYLNELQKVIDEVERALASAENE